MSVGFLFLEMVTDWKLVGAGISKKEEILASGVSDSWTQVVPTSLEVEQKLASKML